MSDFPEPTVISWMRRSPPSRPSSPTATQLSEIWFLYDESEIRLSLNTSRRKTRNLMARPQATLLILDLANPARYLEIRAHARVDPDDDLVFAHKVHEKYGADVAAYDQPGDRRVVVTLEPTRIRPVDMSA